MNDQRNGDCPCQGGGSVSRRGALEWGTYVLGGLAAAATGIPIVGFLLGPLTKHSDRWIAAGTVTEFPEGQTRLVDLVNPLGKSDDGESGKIAVYVRRVAGEQFQIFAVNCTHLGCPVNWIPTAGLFMCPCHGGVFYDDGSHASGPPPRGLYEYEHRIEEGRLMVKLGHLPTLQQPA
ncbi:ubiquinol-cytochrome c reductase iron-sulfur subunit [Allorhodopirellula heiligendammensis]|uniref:Cytochrome b6-f complex iron-sulfur subunit n=1 Tax=Allorhodopirellula heiligendammensis TaxID=2714739 RepID=A0A5C6BI33_9BACT|nr:Rieske 2Fe-2S domain-containing protein [Allorhodopirellula heiligendammensis]TWU10859.1 Cytochrome b6-f complex iron-sulfur subunit [Allorhodopirellula heiligendammensis]